MTESGWVSLREYLLASYGELVRILTQRLRSQERAEDALQDTYLRLERCTDTGPVHSPRGYLLRMAQNIATDRLRAEKRYVSAASDGGPNLAEDVEPAETQRLTVAEGIGFIHSIDDAPGPEQVAIARSDLKLLAAIVEELPARRRAIFVAAWIEGRSHQEISAKFGISLRSVQNELQLARHYCITRFYER